MLKGTLWTFSSRFWAVTTSSCTVEPPASAAKADVAPVSAAISAMPLAARIQRPRDPVPPM